MRINLVSCSVITPSATIKYNTKSNKLRPRIYSGVSSKLNASEQLDHIGSPDMKSLRSTKKGYSTREPKESLPPRTIDKD